MEEGSRFKTFYHSQTNIKHLKAETDLPDPAIEELDQGDNFVDVTLAHEDHHQSGSHRVLLTSSTPKTPRQNIKQMLQEQSQKMKVARRK